MDCTWRFITNQKIRVHACQTILVHIRKIQPSIFACTLALLKHNCDLTLMQRFVHQIKTIDFTFWWCFDHFHSAPYVWTFLKWHADDWPAPSVCSHRVITCFTLTWPCSLWSDAKFSLIWWNISDLNTALFCFFPSPGRWVFGQLYPEHFVNPVPTLRRHCCHRLMAALQRGGKAVQRRRPPLLHWLLASRQEDFADHSTRNLRKLLMSAPPVVPVVKQRNPSVAWSLALFFYAQCRISHWERMMETPKIEKCRCRIALNIAKDSWTEKHNCSLSDWT